VQYEAIRRQAVVTERDTARSARLGVVQAVESARAATRELTARAAASHYGMKTSEAAAEQYRAGEMSAIDAITTEQTVTQAQLDGLGARLSLAILTAQVRYEAGALLPYSISGGEVSFSEPVSLFPGR
jgi:outer membrane protein TolC